MIIRYSLRTRTSLFMRIFVALIFLINAFPSHLKAKETKSWWEIILQVSGISATPSGQKGGLGDKYQSGELWVVSARGGSPTQIVEGREFQSPIFFQEENVVLALKEGQVVRIKVSGFIENASSLFSVESITKLVGVMKNNPDRILILLKNDHVALLSLETGTVSHISSESSPKMTRMVNHLRGWSREYGDIRLYVHRETKDDIVGTIEWTDVYLKNGSKSAINISRCAGTNCSQPSLSSDGRFVVFVKESMF